VPRSEFVWGGRDEKEAAQLRRRRVRIADGQLGSPLDHFGWMGGSVGGESRKTATKESNGRGALALRVLTCPLCRASMPRVGTTAATALDSPR
jgi:hypothetical protein